MQVQVIGKIARFSPGIVLSLTDEQAFPRSISLRHVKGSSFKVLETIEFKAGEVLGVSGKVGNELLQSLKVVEEK